LAEELGGCVAPIPALSSIGLAARALLQLDLPEVNERWLPDLARGEIIGTLACAEGAAEPDSPACATVFKAGRISGTKWPVADAGAAHIAIVSAVSDTAPALVLVELGEEGARREALEAFDLLRPQYMLELRDTPATLLASGAGATAVLCKLFDYAAVHTAFEQVGGAAACLEMARTYVLQRRTFGRLVGSYQAVKHKLADLLAKIEIARSNAYFAAWAADNDPAKLAAAAAVARISATDAYESAAQENLHLHGGFGYTWEADCHFHYRRSRLLANSLGSRRYWSDRLIATLESGGSHGFQ
jgi:alkylation response protein AidB-like acyl-CoA dehydrogenase